VAVQKGLEQRSVQSNNVLKYSMIPRKLLGSLEDILSDTIQSGEFRTEVNLSCALSSISRHNYFLLFYVIV
jgi:ribosome biogenesis protein Nip4